MPIELSDIVHVPSLLDPAQGRVVLLQSQRLQDVPANAIGLLPTNGTACMTGSLTPCVTNTYDLGSATLRWRTVYTSDLSLKNDVGDWTIVEGEDDLFITNNKTGRKYKFALIEVGDGH